MKAPAWLLGAAAALALVAVGGAAWWWTWASGQGTAGAVAIDPDDAELVARGEMLYAEHCASCHGTDLEGQANWRTRRADGRLPAPPHDPSGHTWHHPDEQLFAMTKYGVAALAGPGYESDMPAYEDILSDREIAAVLAYIKSTWPAEIRARHDQINRQFRQQQQSQRLE